MGGVDSYNPSPTALRPLMDMFCSPGVATAALRRTNLSRFLVEGPPRRQRRGASPVPPAAGL